MTVAMSLAAVSLAAGSSAIVSSAVTQAAADGRPAFETATVKLAAPDAVRNVVLYPSPNRLSIPGMTLRAMIYSAYGEGGYNTSMRVTGGPDWSNATAFAVEGVAPGPSSPRQLRRMLQTLLEDRFALTLRDASETVDVLTLIVGRSDGTLGPQVRTWDGTCPAVMPALFFQAPRRPLQRVDGKFVVGAAAAADDAGAAYCPTGYRQGGISADGVTMATVAELLSLPPARALLGGVTHDRTGLTGRYTMELTYPFPTTGQVAPEVGAPSLSTAVREQWGLRLVPGTGEFKVLVVERAQLPAGN